MIVLNAFFAIDSHPALLTLITATLVTAIDLMAVNHCQPMAADCGENLVAPCPPVDMAENAANVIQIENFRNIGDLVAAGDFRVLEEPTQRIPVSVLIQGIHAWQPAQKEDQNGFETGRCWDPPLFTSITNRIKMIQQPEYLLPV
jgi:hypothetical protein